MCYSGKTIIQRSEAEEYCIAHKFLRAFYAFSWMQAHGSDLAPVKYPTGVTDSSCKYFSWQALQCHLPLPLCDLGPPEVEESTG
jgi:hypothetical protein